MKEAIIRLENVTKIIKGHVVLDAVCAEFVSGKTYGIIGRNGSGKSMLLRAICGFLRPTSGEIWVRGQLLGRDVDYPSDIGFLIESPKFPRDLCGIQVLSLLASLRKILSESDIRAVMERIGLDPDDRRPVRKYSTGMRQRLGLAQALMENPSLIILDEPMNGIDKQGVSEIHRLLIEQQQNGKTILLTSHIPGDIEKLCDTIYEIDSGKLQKWEDSSCPVS